MGSGGPSSALEQRSNPVKPSRKEVTGLKEVDKTGVMKVLTMKTEKIGLIP